MNKDLMGVHADARGIYICMGGTMEVQVDAAGSACEGRHGVYPWSVHEAMLTGDLF